MRLLSDVEQEICNRILKNSGLNNFIGNIIDTKLKGVCIEVKRNPKRAGLIFSINPESSTNDDFNKIVNKAEELSIYILQIVNLLKMLEKEGYILLLERGSNSKQDNKFGGCVRNLPSISHSFTDENIISLLCEYTNKEIYSTPEFERFCKNGYVPRDEQRFKRQIFITQLALVVAVLALLFNVSYNMFKASPDNIKLNKDQYQNLSMSFDEIKSKLNLINDNSNKRTNVDAVESINLKLDSIVIELKNNNKQKK